MAPPRYWLAILFAAGCSSARYGASETGAPAITMPAHFAEGSGEEKDGGAPVQAADAGAAGAPAAALPDPEPLLSSQQWEYELAYVKGTASVKSVRPVALKQPVPTARRMGRFAFELWIGKELVDRVRFDFPLLGADAPETRPRPLHEDPRFAPGAETSRRILVPASDRATRAVIVDRQTGDLTEVPWPPPVAAPP
jgi:hypothetical protein